MMRPGAPSSFACLPRSKVGRATPPVDRTERIAEAWQQVAWLTTGHTHQHAKQADIIVAYNDSYAVAAAALEPSLAGHSPLSRTMHTSRYVRSATPRVQLLSAVDRTGFRYLHSARSRGFG